MIITTERKVQKVSFVKLYVAALGPASTICLPYAGVLLLMLSLAWLLVWFVGMVFVCAGVGTFLLTRLLPPSEYDARVQAVKRLQRFNPATLLMVHIPRMVYYAIRYGTLRLPM